MSSTLTTSLLLVAALAADGTQQITTQGAHFELGVFKWDGPIPARRQILVKNRYGDVRIRKSDLPRLFVSAQIQRFDHQQAEPVLAVLERSDGLLEVQIEHEHPGSVGPDGDRRAGFAGRIDVTLLVPNEASVVAETTEGALRVKGFSGAITARTDDGDLYYNAHGKARLRSERGSIEAIVTDYLADQPMKISSDQGPIRLRMTPEASARLVVRTAGMMEMAFINGIEVQNRCDAASCEITLGEGRRQIRVDSRAGPVSLTVDRSFSPDPGEDWRVQ